MLWNLDDGIQDVLYCLFVHYWYSAAAAARASTSALEFGSAPAPALTCLFKMGSWMPQDEFNQKVRHRGFVSEHQAGLDPLGSMLTHKKNLAVTLSSGSVSSTVRTCSQGRKEGLLLRLALPC